MRYQDYVIKEGKFVGEFEKMYQECDDPWHQTKEAEISYSRMDTVCSIRRFGLKNILEVGCGLGYFTSYLQEQCRDSVITGMDISRTAVEKARKIFPEVNFFQGDLGELKGDLLEKYDGIIFSEILWYILDRLDDILKEIKNVRRGGALVVNQTFYTGGQQYGREFFTNQDEMIRYIGLPVLARTSAKISDVTSSYETHTVFRI